VYVYVIASGLIVFWLNGTRIIATDRRVWSQDRVSIEGQGNAYNLRMHNLQEWDDGKYSCQVPGQHLQTSRVIISSKFELMLACRRLDGTFVISVMLSKHTQACSQLKLFDCSLQCNTLHIHTVLPADQCGQLSEDCDW